jgi:hypothetical protein
VHRLLLTPERRILRSTFRLPMMQDPTGVIAGNLRETLMDRDSLRRIKTTGGQSRKLIGTIDSPQVFTRPDGGVNQPGSMDAGAHKMNARRLVGKTPGSAKS